MPPLVIGLIVVQVVAFVLLVVLTVQAFRTHVAWGLAPLLLLVVLVGGNLLQIPPIPLGVGLLAGLVGTAVFALRNWKRAGVLFLLYLLCVGTGTTLTFTSSTVIAFLTHYNPRFATSVKLINPHAYEESQKLTPSGQPLPPPKPTPHEVRDLAETETPDPTPRVDPNPVARAAYAKHNKDLAALYGQLNTERAKLKPGSPAVAAYNAKAAKYQQGLAALADEKAKLDALDHAANLPGDAAAALTTLQNASAVGDYETFAATTKKALDEYRQAPSFPAITALARTTLGQVTPDKVAAGAREKAVRTVRADFDKTTRQIQGIVNQTPAIVGQPPAGAEIARYTYRPAANPPAPPNYQADNLLATRELLKGQFACMAEAPKVFYHAADCEFNPQLQSFYLNRTVPKKRLNDAEYQELTRLFRQLGQQDKALANAAPPAGLADRVTSDLAALKLQLDSYAMK